jgi:hypothetical protein
MELKCENCGAAIGKLETPRVYGDHVVCATCAPKVHQANAPAPVVAERESRGVWTTLIVLACLLVPVAGMVAYTTLKPTPKPASVAGSVWLSDRAGRSELQRGEFVHLVRARITPADLRKVAGEKAAEIQRRAAGASDNSGIGDDAKALIAAAAAVKSDIYVDDAVKLLNQEPWGHYQQTVPSDFWWVATQHTRTDVSGAYRFDNVAPGLYYLLTSPGPARLDEMVSVKEGEQVKQDLHN